VLVEDAPTVITTTTTVNTTSTSAAIVTMTATTTTTATTTDAPIVSIDIKTETTTHTTIDTTTDVTTDITTTLSACTSTIATVPDGVSTAGLISTTTTTATTITTATIDAFPELPKNANTVLPAEVVVVNSVEPQGRKPKRSRWGTAAPTADSTTVAVFKVPGGRKTRWGDVSDRQVVVAADPRQEEARQLQQHMARVSTLLLDEDALTAAAEKDKVEAEGSRAPSPEPEYDEDGRRTNTRIQRFRGRLMRERQELVGRQVALTQTPELARLLEAAMAKELDIDIPTFESHPNYNFVGCVIGARGNTQKRLERETGALDTFYNGYTYASVLLCVAYSLTIERTHPP
jgi:hypothetical protein